MQGDSLSKGLTTYTGLAADPWGVLKAAALGFTRTKLPHAMTIRRALARFSLEQFRLRPRMRILP